MSEAGWPEDPKDPRCPACGEPVSATASYCMHCEADLPTADATGDAATVVESEASTTAASTTTETSASTTTAASTTTETSSAATGEGGTGLLHPDGLLDNTATLVVAVVAGLLSAVLAAILLSFPLPGGGPFLAGVLVWLAVARYVAASPSVDGAVRRGGFAVAGLLAVLPFAVGLTVPMQNDSIGQRLAGILVFGFFAWPTAVVIAGVGFLVDRLVDRG